MKAEIKQAIRPLYYSDGEDPVGTAVVVGIPPKESLYSDTGLYWMRMLIITCKHTITHSPSDDIQIEFNDLGRISLNRSGWWCDDVYDLAIYSKIGKKLPDNIPAISAYQIDVYSDIIRSYISDDKIREGTDLLLAGYPTGWKQLTKTMPIFRHGMIADMTDWGQPGLTEILVDSNGYEGQSGGPIFIRPGAYTDKQGQIYSLVKEAFLGIMTQYTSDNVPYTVPHRSENDYSKDILIPRNTGLVAVCPVHSVQESIRKFFESEQS